MTGQVCGRTVTYDLSAQRVLADRFVEFAYRDGPFRDTFAHRRADDSWISRLEHGDGRGACQQFAEYPVRRIAARGR
jgi:hypothetical protein